MLRELVMMIGVPASGKSTLATWVANYLCEQGTAARIFSSDDIREKWYGDAAIQGDNAKIFHQLHKDLID